jgi:hypothetical protein
MGAIYTPDNAVAFARRVNSNIWRAAGVAVGISVVIFAAFPAFSTRAGIIAGCVIVAISLYRPDPD